MACCFVAAVFSILGATSCSDDDDNIGDPSTGRMVALVTYTGTRDVTLSDGTTYVSTFEYVGTDNIATSCYSSVDSRIPTDVVAGQRMVISYTNSGTGSGSNNIPAGEITLLSYVLVPTPSVTVAPQEEAVANNAEMPLYYPAGNPSINRTGNYINLEVYMPYYSEREFTIVADESTLATSTPHLYASTQAKGAPQGVKSVTLVSFDISEVWRDPSVTGVVLHVNNTAGAQTEFEFSKY